MDMKSLYLAIGFLAAGGSAFAGDKGGKLPWKKDLAAGLKEAKQSGKPLAAYFTSDG